MNKAVTKAIATLLAGAALLAVSTQVNAWNSITSRFANFEFIEIDSLSLPAVIWLFNGALLSLLGLARRKKKPVV